MTDFGVDPVAIDLGHLVRRNVASLYSSLVTRPTGQAVRLAIENVLADEAGPVTLSVVDFSQVTVIDFSCADEVVAKLLLRYLGGDRPRDALFIFRGIQDLHRDPIEVVLERHSLVAVAQTPEGTHRLMGAFSEEEGRVWEALEARGSLGEDEAAELVPELDIREVMERLVGRRVAFRSPETGKVRALSTLTGDLA